MNLHYETPSPVDFASIVNQTADGNLCKLTCSTVPLLDYWKDPEKRIERLRRELQFQASGIADLCFEFPVKSFPPQNKASFTDVMYSDNDTTIAVEGKWTENLDKSVSGWLAAGKVQKNREEVLNHWLCLIESKNAADVDRTKILDVPYQLVHRTASACSLHKECTFVVVQIFVSERTKYLLKHRRSIDSLVEAIHLKKGLEIWLHTVSMKETDSYRRRADELARTSKPSDKSMIVRSALLKEQLFNFGEERFERITYRPPAL